MKRWIIGDLHGAHKALVQCLERSGFDRENDLLVSIGDIVDGWSETYECVEELLTIKNLIVVRGNHDDYFINWLKYGQHDWLHGGHTTAQSYIDHAERKDIELGPSDFGGWITNLTNIDIPQSHIDFFNSMSVIVKLPDNKGKEILFVHGGIPPGINIDDALPHKIMWTRQMASDVYFLNKIGHQDSDLIDDDRFSKVFIGHTATTNYHTDKPMEAGGVVNIDTGAGWDGKLTIMNIDDTSEYYQSDNAKEDLYKQEKGRM